jgi:site-specific recombinase XerC
LVDAILRTVRSEKDERIRLRDEAILALLLYAVLRAHEAYHVQIRDLDLASGNVTIRHGKGGRMRRVVLQSDTILLLRRYLS